MFKAENFVGQTSSAHALVPGDPIMLFDIISRQDFCGLQTDTIYFFDVTEEQERSGSPPLSH